MRKLLASLFTSALLFGGLAGSASAQVQQDGLVNVAIGDITIEDVNVAVAAQIVATVCANVDLEAAVAIVGAIDAGPTGATDQVCRIGGGQSGGRGPTVTVIQN
jgi:hypothetical protein